MHPRSTLLGVVAALALLSAPLRHTVAQETPSTVPAAYTYLPAAIHDHLAGVLRADAIHKVTTSTSRQGTTVVLEIPPASLSDEFVTASDYTAARAAPAAAPEETARAAPEAALVLIQINPDGSIDIVSPQGDLQQIK